MMGFARVRRCDLQPEGFYLLGLEFREPLTRDGSETVLTGPGAWHVRVGRGNREWNAADDAY
jgi:hypothetical protein